jgi:hypothetical protein
MMNKLYERHPTREVNTHLPETHEVLPEFPDDVTIPDDISGLTHPATTEDRRPTSGLHWMRWLAIAILVAAGAVALGSILRTDDTTTPVMDGYTTAEINRMNVLHDLEN